MAHPSSEKSNQNRQLIKASIIARLNKETDLYHAVNGLIDELENQIQDESIQVSILNALKSYLDAIAKTPNYSDQKTELDAVFQTGIKAALEGIVIEEKDRMRLDFYAEAFAWSWVAFTAGFVTGTAITLALTGANLPLAIIVGVGTGLLAGVATFLYQVIKANEMQQQTDRKPSEKVERKLVQIHDLLTMSSTEKRNGFFKQSTSKGEQQPSVVERRLTV